MKRYISLGAGMFFLLCSKTVGELLTQEYTTFITLIGGLFGAILISVFIYNLIEESNKKNMVLDDIKQSIDNILKNSEEQKTIVETQTNILEFSKKICDLIEKNGSEFSQKTDCIEKDFKEIGKLLEKVNVNSVILSDKLTEYNEQRAEQNTETYNEIKELVQNEKKIIEQNNNMCEKLADIVAYKVVLEKNFVEEKQISETLRNEVSERTKWIESSLCEISQLMETANQNSVTLSDKFAEYNEQRVEQSTEMYNEVKELVQNEKKIIEQNNNMCEKLADIVAYKVVLEKNFVEEKQISETLRNEVSERTKRIESSLCGISQLMETVNQNNVTLSDKLAEYNAQRMERNTEMYNQIKELAQSGEKAIEQLAVINDQIKQLEKIPDLLDDSLEDWNEKSDKLEGNMAERLESMCGNIEDNTERLMKAYKQNIEDLLNEIADVTDGTEENNKSMEIAIENLTVQFNEFKKLTETMIQQFTMMSEEDIKILKGLMNG